MGAELPQHHPGQPQCDGNAQKGDKRHRGVIVQHDGESTCEFYGRRGETGEKTDDAVGHYVYVGVQAVQKIAAAVRLQRLPPGAQDVPVGHVLHLVFHVHVDAGTHPGGNALQNKASQQHDGHNGHGAPQHIRAVARDRVDEIFGGHAGNKTHNRAGQAQQPYGEDLSLIAPDLRLQPL